MRAPAFWWRERPGLQARLLMPLATLYGAIASQRMARAGVRADVPVLCIGNFVAGGAGKTPTAIALAKMLRARGESPAFLSRGFGGALSGPAPLHVDPTLHLAADVGDEPLLLARVAPAFICTDRIAGAQAAVRHGASVIVMDDGLQNPALAKDLVIAAVDGATGIGNGLCIPSGPLRAPMAVQWRAADAVLVIGGGEAGAAVASAARAAGRLVLGAQLAPSQSDVARLLGKRVFAFAGIGRPEKFYATLRACKAQLVGTHSFADHHPYGDGDLAALGAQAKAQGAELLVTTEKDAARIAPGALPGLSVLPVELIFDAPDDVAALLARLLSRA